MWKEKEMSNISSFNKEELIQPRNCSGNEPTGRIQKGNQDGNQSGNQKWRTERRAEPYIEKRFHFYKKVRCGTVF